MSDELQRLLGIAAILLAIGMGIGACSLGFGYGTAAKISAENRVLSK